MLRDILYLVTLVGITAGAVLAAPEAADRPRPEWHVQVCAEYDVC
jgi:hypothetical protein